MTAGHIAFELNGQPIEIVGEPDRTLLEVLRDELNLTGTKQGCDNEGQCGACTVIIDNRAVRACRTKIGTLAGKRVTTIEGLGAPGRLHPLQRAFIECGAVQCGFCTPGMLMAAAALLARNPDPTPAEIRRALRGNLCRCTGYASIIRAVQQAAAELRGEPIQDAFSPNEIIGGDARRLDAVDKVTGRTRFAADIPLPGALHVVVVRSPHASASIEHIDRRAALSVPGVEAVLTAADIPGACEFDDAAGTRERVNGEADKSAFEPILAGEVVRMLGEPVALVVGTSEKAARAGAARVEVSYQLEQPVYAPRGALRGAGATLYGSHNLYEHGELVRGLRDLFQGSAELVETGVEIPCVEHAPIEPDCVLAYPDDDGRLVVIGPTHQPHVRQGQIAAMLAIPPERVRVSVPPLGGSFGGRHYFWPVVAAALPAYLLQRPVRMAFSRREVFEGTLKSFPFELALEVGARADGTLTGLRARAWGSAGPYGGAPTTAPFVVTSTVGPYVWQGVDLQVDVAHTNGPNAGPLRGYAMPHGALAIEMALDELAQKLELDPWQLRWRNAADQSSGAATGQPFDDPFGFREVLKTIHPAWQRARQETGRPSDDPLLGAGLAASWYQFGKSGPLSVPAEVELSLDGQVVVFCTAMNSGQGLNTVMAQMAARELELDRTLISVVNSDTDRTLDSHIYGACKSTFWIGGAVAAASHVLRERIVTTAAGLLQVDPAAVHIDHQGCVVAGQRSCQLAEIAAQLERDNLSRRVSGRYELESRYPSKGRPLYLGHFTVGAAVVQLAVNPGNGKVTLQRVVVAQDVGKAINPLDVRGQIEGAIAMEIGAALIEQYRPGHSQSWRSYPIPRIKDIPELQVIVIEVPGRDGPLGAKGIGEAAAGHVRAAILNAVSRAIGVRLHVLPLTPERVLAALNSRAPRD